MDAHPAAALFPLLSSDEMAGLAADIKEHGQHQPIATWHGVILDGRNRFAACTEAEVKPIFTDLSHLSESDAIALIVSCNLKRRHLTVGQRAMIASDLAKLGHGARADLQDRSIDLSKQILTQPQAAKLMGVGSASVRRARAVHKADPVLAEEVKAGKITVHKAQEIIRKRDPKAKQPAPRKSKKSSSPHAVRRAKLVIRSLSVDHFKIIKAWIIGGCPSE